MSRRLSWQLALAVGVIGMGLTGCKTGQPVDKTTRNDIFYPAPPAPPRLQFLASFNNGYAMIQSKEKQSSLGEWVVGAKKEDTTKQGKFSSPYGVAARNGKIYLCDVGSNCVHVIDLAHNTYRRLGNKNLLRNPVNLTIDEDGTRYLCDTGRRKVLVFDANDQFVRDFGDPDQWMPIDLAIHGDELFIADVTGGEIEVWSKQGKKLRTISRKGPGPDELTNPTNLDFGPDGRLYVTDSIQQIVKIFTPQGQYAGAISGPGTSVGRFARPKGIAVDPNNQIYVADAQWEVIQIYNTKGELMLYFGKPGDKPYNTSMPAGLAIDASSVPFFKSYMNPNFRADYLLFVVNQFGDINKLAVYAYGKDTSIDPAQYRINFETVKQRREELRRMQQKNRKENKKENKPPSGTTGPTPAPAPAPAPKS